MGHISVVPDETSGQDISQVAPPGESDVWALCGGQEEAMFYLDCRGFPLCNVNKRLARTVHSREASERNVTTDLYDN